MGTRGAYGIRKGGVDKIMYNHFDSYPTALGTTMMDFVKSMNDNGLSEQFDFMQEIDSNTPATKEQWDKCQVAEAINLTVSEQKEEDWYCILRNLQGELSKQSPPNGVPYFINDNNFVKDSLFCEWGYIVNVDTGKLEVYKGFNREKGGKGRYANLHTTKKPVNYYGVTLLAEIPFDDIRKWNDEETGDAAIGLETAILENPGDGDEKSLEGYEFVRSYLV